jgi:cell division protein FtsA
MNRDIKAIGLDIGTSKVRCVVGEAADNGRMNVIGIGEAESKGLRRGIVTGAEAVAESVRKAVGEAERVSGLDIMSAVVNLSGEHFRGENKNGVVAVAGAGREITEEDVERAIESASAMPLPSGWEIFSRLPQEFIIDGQDGIRHTGIRQECQTYSAARACHRTVQPSRARIAGRRVGKNDR